uniref:Fork-head domain-containing protein n=1 Tax=Strigamia maritima TaxID=126957 RepID=T1JJB6_STRMM
MWALMETFEASLQEMIDCDMRTQLDGIANGLTPAPLDLDADLMADTSTWSTTQSYVYSDLEPVLFVNPQTALPNHTKSYIAQDVGSPAVADTPRAQPITPKTPEPTGGDAAPFATKPVVGDTKRVFPKPAYSYSCLIAMALKNSKAGCLPVSEIYSFMTENFPYFKTAPNGWKNSVRHNLSLNKCFEKVEKSSCANNQRKGCLWTMNPSKVSKMEEEVQKWSRKDPQAIKRSMAKPENLELLALGCDRKAYDNTIKIIHENSSSKTEFAGSELDILDTGLQLDASLPDLNLQTGIWDEFDVDRIHLDPGSLITVTDHNIHGSFVCNALTVNNNNNNNNVKLLKRGHI